MEWGSGRSAGQVSGASTVSRARTAPHRLHHSERRCSPTAAACSLLKASYLTLDTGLSNMSGSAPILTLMLAEARSP